MKGITFGVWDMLHFGHIRFFERAKDYADTLTVGVCSDSLNFSLKGRDPIIADWQRLYLINSLKVVDKAFIYRKTDYIKWIKGNQADVFIAGQEFGAQKVPEHLKVLDYCRRNNIRIVRLPRTPEISTTELRERVCSCG